MSVQNPGWNHAHTAPSALDATLRAATRRIRLLLALRYGGKGFCWSALACLLLVGAGKIGLLADPSPWLLTGLIVLSLLIGVAMALLRPLRRLDVAKMTERRSDLKERLSSALEFRLQGVDSALPFYGELWTDADRHAVAVDVKAAYPARIPREFPVGLLATLALVLLVWLPYHLHPPTPGEKRDQELVVRHGLAIVKLTRDTEKAADQQKLEETRKAAVEAQKLGEAMRKGKLNKKQSLVALEKLTRKMEETQQRMAQSLPQKSLQQAHEEFKKSLAKLEKDAEHAQLEARKLKTQEQMPRNLQKPGDKNAMTTPKDESQAMKQAREALKQMADALANQDKQQMQSAMEKIAQQMQSGQMSKQEMQQLQQALQQLAQALKNSDQNQAAQQLQQMAQQMQQSLNNLDPKTLQQMAQMMQQIGRQMGKNPGSGKMQMDQQMLQQLAQALKDGRMTMVMGKNPGAGPGAMSGTRKRGPGTGYNGLGGPSTAMKDPGNTSPKLLAMGKSEKTTGVGKSGSAKDFAKYLAAGAAAPKHLPNGKIPGTRSEQGNEMQMSFTGDPDPAKSNAPYYNAYQTSKRQAESTLDKENIPAAYKEQVRKYFEEIRP